MKRTRRTLSLLLALVMLLSILPELHLPVRAEDETDLTIDFEYEKKYNVKSREDALLVTAESQIHDHDKEYPSQPITSLTDLKNRYGEFYWQKATIWTVKDHDDRSLRKLLTSTDDKDKYIVLNQDDDHDYYKSDLWETIEITTDKVLDLNGRKIKIRYDSNRSNDDPDQTDHIEYHNCTAFRISKGATLTIIDSSAWRGENGGKGHGMIYFSAYRVNPFSYPINTYTTRDLFDVSDGNLVIYGGTFKAGNSKTFYKSKFSWEKLRTTIGTALELGVNIAEYATGLDAATSSYKDLLQSEKSSDLDRDYDDSDDDDDGTDGPDTTRKKDGTDAPEEDQKDSPTGAKNHNKSVDEKQEGKNDGENKANAKKTGKNDKNTKLAEGRKKVVESAVNKKGIGGMVDKVFQLGENIAGMIGKDKGSFCVESIMGTVVKVGNGSSFISYGGTYEGYGSTPNTRNAVVEVNYNPGSVCSFDSSKVQGGYVYIFDGTFEGYTGANIFNFVRSAPGTQYGSQILVGENGERPTEVVDGETVDKKSTVALSEAETGGVEVYYYDNQDKAGDPGFEPKLVNTANVQVRGGVFRNHYELQNVAIKDGSSENFNKFPGTNGSVNLGIESFGEDLIRDGRIQIVDKYHDGALVLLDKQTAERKAAQEAGEPFTEGLYRYRLLCGDTELRAKSYLQVYPNPAKTNAAKSMILASYGGEGEAVSKLWVDDKDNDRAPLAQTENYFDFIYNRGDSGNYAILPMFHDPDSTDPKYPEFSAWTTNLGNSEFWYYPTPMVKKPKQSKMVPLPEVPYGDAWYVGTDKQYEQYGWTTKVNQHICRDTYTFEWFHNYPPYDYYWDWGGSDDWKGKLDSLKDITYHFYKHDDLKTTQRYFTYKVYRVDPLTRENLVESNEYGKDSPLITVRYGASDDSLKCKLPLLDVEQQIKKRQEEENVPVEQRWKGFQSGEMYRVTLTVEEDIACGYKSDLDYMPDVFGKRLDTAKTEASILFRCLTDEETTLEHPDDPLFKNDFTPLQWNGEPEVGSYGWIDLTNGKAGMTDYKALNKVFDVYYQWWETDKDGNPLRLIAGTDNIYEGDQSERENHHPQKWNVTADHIHTYVNTVDPMDPKADSYTYHGLPGDADGNPLNKTWTAQQLHMYSAQLVKKENLRLGPGNLSPKNNNVYATNFDTCYLPEELAGKYIRVCCIVVNPEWKDYFDAKQTFWSHTKYLDPGVKLNGVAELDKHNAVYGRINHLSIKLYGTAYTLPEEIRHITWQRRSSEDADWEDIPDENKMTYTIPWSPPTDRFGQPYLYYRAVIKFDGYYNSLVTKVPCEMVSYMPLHYYGPDVEIPIGDVNTVIQKIHLPDYVSNGTGNYTYKKYEGPSWLQISSSGDITGTRPATAQSAATLRVGIKDTVMGEETMAIIPVGAVVISISGTVNITGIPRPSFDSDSPNVLTATVNGCNETELTYEWKGKYTDADTGEVGYYRRGTGQTYEIVPDDANSTLVCFVSGKNTYGTIQAEVNIGQQKGPDAPVVTPCGPKSNGAPGEVFLNLRVESGVYPLEISKTADFSHVYAQIDNGDFHNVTLGTWYVRSAARHGYAAGDVAKVEITESDLFSLAHVDPVPFGVTGESFSVTVKAINGTPPYTFGYVNQYNHISEMERIDDATVRIYGTFSGYSGPYREQLKITDGNGDWAYGSVLFEGWDHETTEENVADASTEDTGLIAKQHLYTTGTGKEMKVNIANRGANTLDLSGLTVRMVAEDTDSEGNTVETDVTSMFEILPDTARNSLGRGDTYHLKIRFRPDNPACYLNGSIYLGGVPFHSEDMDEDGCVGFWSVYYTGRMQDCTVEPVGPMVADGSYQDPNIRIRDSKGNLLEEGKHYTLEITGDTRLAGDCSFKATGIGIDAMGSYEGSLEGSFTIAKTTTEDRDLDVYVEASATTEQRLYYSSLVNDSFLRIANARFLSLDDPSGTVSSYRVLATGYVNLTPNGTAKDGDACDLAMEVDTQNCETYQITIHVHYTDRKVPNLIIRPYKRVYDGTAVRAEDLEVYATVDGVPIPGNWSFVDPLDFRLVRYGMGESVQVRFTPEDETKYAPVYGRLSVSTQTVQVTGEPCYNVVKSKPYQILEAKMYQAGLTTEGGTFSVPGAVKWDVSLSTTITYGTAYDWTFTPADKQDYTPIHGKTVLYRGNEAKRVRLTVENYTKVYDGKPVKLEDLTKSATYNGEPVPGTWSFDEVTEDDLIDVNDGSAGENYYLLHFTPDGMNGSDDGYIDGYVGVWITIQAIQPTGEPNWTRITEAGKHLSDVDLSDLGGTFSVPGTVSFDVPLDTEVMQDVAYPWTFKPADPYHSKYIYGSLIPWRSKEPVKLTVEPFTKTYDGKKLTLDQLTKTATFEGKSVEGVWSFVKPDDPALTNAHEEQTVELRFTPRDTENYLENKVQLTLSIEQAPASGRPAFTEINEAGKTLEDTNLTTTGSTFSVPGVVYYELPEDTEVTENTAYVWYFVPNGANYETISGTVVPWGEAPDTDKGELGSAVEAAEKVDKSKYTAESVAVLEAAVAAAKAVQADTGATQAAVDAAAKAVRDAIAALVQAGGDPGNPFVDVKSGAFYYDPVLWAVGHDPQITKGTDTTHFSPDDTCTRGQVVTFLWRAKGCPEPTLSLNPFSDVKEGAFYYKAVLWAVQNGITNGVDKTHFGPNMGCTRGQVVTFLWRAEGQPVPGSDANPFKDVKGGFYYSAVLWAVEKNITKGTSANKFSPDQTCTRGQIVTFLYRDMS